ncbi:hypothetical protein [Micromonospora sonneratiae]|uniref:Uncharacterized protein n=1 Tax=Micromonospora sonneratiae TaxID=1184706 RepID=A0ABW3YND5_9ACTN
MVGLDPVSMLARLLTRPVVWVLDIDGATLRERQAELLEHVSLPGEDLDDLGLRHLSRSVVWMAAFVVGFLVFLGPTILITELMTEEAARPYLFAIDLVVFFAGAMGIAHAIKVSVAHYLPERWWNPKRWWWRVTMLAQLTDVIPSVVAAAIIAASLSG